MRPDSPLEEYPEDTFLRKIDGSDARRKQVS
jgi:hypothetical protein